MAQEPEADDKKWPPEIKRRSGVENQALERLYGSKHGEPGHAEAEADFNRARKERMIAEGSLQGEYQPQRDVRHEFDFKPHPNAEKGEVGIVAKGPLHNPDEVINWRHTEVGKAADAEARSAYLGSGDDAGHLISPEFGADPGEPLNLSGQHHVANQQGEYKYFEDHCKEIAANQERPHDIEVRVKMHPHEDGMREYVREMKLSQTDEHGNKAIVAHGTFANPTSSAQRAADVGNPPDRAPDWDLYHVNKAAHADPRMPAEQAAFNRLKKDESVTLTPEQEASRREQLKARLIPGGDRDDWAALKRDDHATLSPEQQAERRRVLDQRSLDGGVTTWSRLKHRNSADLTPEEKLQLREEMRDRAMDGGKHHKKKEH